VVSRQRAVEFERQVIEESSSDAEVVILGIRRGVFGDAAPDLKVRGEPPGSIQLRPELVTGVLRG
jgi:hypothetical protein